VAMVSMHVACSVAMVSTHGVAHRRARAVALDERDSDRVDARVLVGAPDALLLPLDGGRVDAGRLAVGRRGTRADDGMDLVRVRAGLGLGLGLCRVAVVGIVRGHAGEGRRGLLAPEGERVRG
jgi:hypothetical protein